MGHINTQKDYLIEKFEVSTPLYYRLSFDVIMKGCVQYQVGDSHSGFAEC